MTDDIEQMKADLESVVKTLRNLSDDKAEKAAEATTAQSTKYNQAAAYSYTISANTVEQVIQDYE
jgi:hypothetical protein